MSIIQENQNNKISTENNSIYWVILTALDLHIGKATSIKSVATLFSNFDIQCKSFLENVSLVSEFSTKAAHLKCFVIKKILILTSIS